MSDYRYTTEYRDLVTRVATHEEWDSQGHRELTKEISELRGELHQMQGELETVQAWRIETQAVAKYITGVGNIGMSRKSMYATVSAAIIAGFTGIASVIISLLR